MKLPIYLDYAATCPVDERVAKKNDGIFNQLTVHSVTQLLARINLVGKQKKRLTWLVIKLQILLVPILVKLCLLWCDRIR